MQGLGLRRNSVAFRIIDNLRTGYIALTRDSNLLQEKTDEQTLARTAPLQELIASRLVALRAAPFMATLGYSMPQHSSPAENTAAPRTRTRTDACGREAAADGAAAEVADATTTPPFEAISDSAARTTWRRCSAAAAAQGAVDASRHDARVAQADAPPALGSCGRGCFLQSRSCSVGCQCCTNRRSTARCIGPGGQDCQRETCLRRCH